MASPVPPKIPRKTPAQGATGILPVRSAIRRLLQLDHTSLARQRRPPALSPPLRDLSGLLFP
jgi:hypothetical protein